MTPPDRLARTGADAIRLAFERYRRKFKAITRRSRRRFEERDWKAGQADAAERLELYRSVVDEVEAELIELLGADLQDAGTWNAMRTIHAASIVYAADAELAETFYNSVTRRIFDTVGVDHNVEYVDLDPRRDRYGSGSTIHRTYAQPSTVEMVTEILRDHPFAVPFRDLEGDARRAAQEIETEWLRSSAPGAVVPVERVELIDSVFFRGSCAHLVGRIRGGANTAPLVIVLVHGDEGVEVDAVLATETEVSIVFSYTRSHFQVEVPRPSDVIRFLSSIMPGKRIADLYIGLGYSKHGKTELYRDLLGHLDRSMDRFVHAPGDVGMVMIVFTLQYYHYVFKVIRDEFAYPKTNTREDVLSRYQLVFEHDRAGRLIEAQEFEHLTFEKSRFSPELLEELATASTESVSVHDDGVTLHHVYIERRVDPLNLFLRASDEADALRAVMDYGHAIRDLACSNIFPGDLLLKNFGVTRHGRVIFYDYDELCLVTECEFRDMPKARDGDEEMAAEPWFFVGEHDVFPEEFIAFMGLTEPQRRVFLAAHADVLTARFWRDLKERHRAGEVVDVFPYPPSKRLARRTSAAGSTAADAG